MKEIEVYNSTNEIEIEQICTLLKENDIICVRKDDGSGDYIKIVYGVNNNVKRIFVSENDYKKSLELIETFNKNLESQDYNEEDIPEELKNYSDEEELENEEEKKKFNKIKKIVLIVFFGIPMAIAILVVLGLVFLL